MIFIDRSRVPVPKFFTSGVAARLTSDLREYFRVAPEWRAQRDPFAALSGRMRPGIRKELFELAHGKCAYCETKLESEAEMVIEDFRPKRLGGDPNARDHYWWLMLEWDNLLPACEKCNAAKRTYFPIRGKRCEIGATGEGLDLEGPLLINPTRVHPEALLIFERSGHVTPRLGDTALTERGAKTIELLQLNRTDLVRARERVATEIIELASDLDIRPVQFLHHGGEMSALIRLVSDTSAYAAAARFTLARNLRDTADSHLREPAIQAGLAFDVTAYVEALSESGGAPSADLPSRRAARPPRRDRTKADPRVKEKASAASAPHGVDFVKRVVIESFRMLPTIEFAVPTERPDDLVPPALRHLDAFQVHRRAGWKLVLGENGAGKSSILHAVALAIMGLEFWEQNEHRFGLASSLRHGQASGRIRVELAESDAIEIELTPKGPRWKAREQGANVFLRGYGATRLLPQRAGSAHAPAKRGRQGVSPVSRDVRSLFDPYAPLVDAEEWLRKLPDADFLAAATSLKALLDIEQEERETNAATPRRDFGFEERDTKQGAFGLWHIQPGHERFEPLAHFSAGYQTLLALACDIMAGSGQTIEHMQDVPGIVLLDEIGTNLHPRWRLDIVRRLGNTFPRMQFLASTHEPLCLRGLGKREVAVIRRDGDDISLRDDMPSPAGLRVDQLLTSEFFGLHTTVDPWTERAFDVYYELLTREATLDAKERETLEQLRDWLSTASVFGSTRRDQVVFAAVDQELSRADPLASPGDVAASEPVREAVRRALSGSRDGAARPQQGQP